MDAGDLHRLAKVLRHLAIDATSDAGEEVSPTEALVGMDLFTHSPTTVTEVARRTGVVQSQVSRLVAQMQTMGIVTAGKDPQDGRRTVLTVTPAARAQHGSRRGARDPRAAIARHLTAVGHHDSPEDVTRVLELLDELTTLLGREPTVRQR